MDLFTVGFPVALTFNNLLYCSLGVFLGTLAGVIPGIGPLMAIALLLPVTFYLEPTTAIIMLAGVYYGTNYGGSTTSILLNVPGEAATAVSCIDGYQMTKRGRAGAALTLVCMGSFMGGSVGILLMMLLSEPFVDFALRFTPADYFVILALALLLSGAIGQGSPLKGIAMITLGTALGLVGTDVNSGVDRFTFGSLNLMDGIPTVVMAMGLFGIAEVLKALSELQGGQSPVKWVPLRELPPSRSELKVFPGAASRGTIIGSVIGVLPGLGPTVATFLSYAFERRVARGDKSRFGKGAPEGVIAPESANNAAAQTAFIPTFALGIPPGTTMAMILGALIMHGVTPGPRLMYDEPELFWGLIASFWIGNLLLVIINIPMIGLWVQVLKTPYRMLLPFIVVFVCVGAYNDGSLFDVGLVLALGLAGYVLRLLDLSPAPVLLGFFLGPLVEENFRRALLLSRGDFSTFVTHPISFGALVAAAILLAVAFGLRLRRRALGKA